MAYTHTIPQKSVIGSSFVASPLMCSRGFLSVGVRIAIVNNFLPSLGYLPASPNMSLYSYVEPGAGANYSIATWNLYSSTASPSYTYTAGQIEPQSDHTWKFNGGPGAIVAALWSAPWYYTSSDWNYERRDKVKIFGPAFGTLAQYLNGRGMNAAPVTPISTTVPVSYEYVEIAGGTSVEFLPENTPTAPNYPTDSPPNGGIDGWAVFWPGKQPSDFSWYP